MKDDTNHLSELKSLANFFEKLMKSGRESIDYQDINDKFMSITEAMYSAFTVFESENECYKTVAVSGDVYFADSVADILEYTKVGKKLTNLPAYITDRKSMSVNRFSSLIGMMNNDILQDKIIHFERKNKTGDVVLVIISRTGVVQGVFTLLMEKGKTFSKEIIASMFASQLGISMINNKIRDALIMEKAFNDVLFDNMWGYLFVYDETGKLIRWNKKHEEISGYSAEELSNMTLDDWFAGEEGKKLALLVAEKIFEKGFGEVEADLKIKDGSSIPIQANCVRLNIHGKNYFAGVGIDISERKMMEEDTIKSKEYFKFMFNTNPDAALISRVSDGIITEANEGYANLTGFSRDELIGKSTAELHIYSEDGERQKIVDELRKEESFSNQEILFQRKNGETYVGLMSAKIIELDGTEYIFCNIRDITEHKNDEENIARGQKKYSRYIENAPNGLFITDKNGRYLEVNKATTSITGYSKEELLNMSISNITDERFISDFTTEIQTLDEDSHLSIDTEFMHKNGTKRWWSLDIVKLEEGHLLGFASDVTDRKKTESDLVYLINHDFLTGIYNRRYYENEAERMDKANMLPLSIIIGDINGLKLINDAFGHEDGDKLIVETVRLIQSCCRPQDVLARIGGDEFSILLPNTDNATAIEILNKIQLACGIYNEDMPNEIFHISISLGCSTKDNRNQDFKDVVKRAEEYYTQRKLLEHRSQRSSIIESIKATMIEKSYETKEHAERLIALSRAMGVVIGLSQTELDHLELFSTLHDIGKVGIDDHILSKPDKLTVEEVDEIRKHPNIGYRIAITSAELMPIAEYILSHHERWDGKGYPQGLAGKEIPLLSRILTIVDAYDAMTQDRKYRKAMSKQAALAEIMNNAGKQFDPELAYVFFETILGDVTEEAKSAAAGGDANENASGDVSGTSYGEYK